MNVLNSKTLYDGKWTFRVDHVQFDNGHEMKLAILDHPGSVVLVPVRGDDVLMIRQFRPVLQQTILELPAGTLELNEDPMEGAQRELREETGYRAGTLTLLSQMAPSPGVTNEIMNIILATDLTEDPLPMDEDEIIELAPMPLSELVDLALQGELLDAKSVIGVLQAKHFLDSQ